MVAFAGYDAILGDLDLAQVFSGEFDDQPNAIRGRFSGSPDTEELYGGQATPIARFRSTDLQTIITGVDVKAGLAIADPDVITIPFQKRANLGVFTAGASHPQVNGKGGLVILTELSAAIGDEGAMAALECWFQSVGEDPAVPGVADPDFDGLTVPAIVTFNNALAAQAFNNMWALGPVRVNTGAGLAALDDIVSVTVSTGIKVQADFKDGTNYPYRIYIVQRDPMITVRFRESDDIPANAYTNIVAAEVYFRKRATVGFVADVTAEHIKLSFADGLAHGRKISSQGTDSGEVTLIIEGEDLTASAVSAIPAIA